MVCDSSVTYYIYCSYRKYYSKRKISLIAKKNTFDQVLWLLLHYEQVTEVVYEY